MRQKNLENGNAENSDLDEASSRFIELQNSIISISDEIFDKIKLKLKNTKPEQQTNKVSVDGYVNLLIKMRNGISMNEAQKIKAFPKNLSDDLDYLEDILVKFYPLARIDNKLIQLREAEAAFDLNLMSKGFRILEYLKKTLEREDHWISWRILELSYKHYGAKGRVKLSAYSNLYQLSKQIGYGFEDVGYVNGLRADYEASQLGKFIYSFKTKRISVLNEMRLRIDELNLLKENLYDYGENPVDIELNKQIASIYILETFEFLHFCCKNEFWGRANLKESIRQIINDLFIHVFPFSFHGDKHLPNSKTYFDALLYENMRCFAIVLNNKFQLNIEESPEILFSPPINEISIRLTVLKIIEKISLLSEIPTEIIISDIESLRDDLDALIKPALVNSFSNENLVIIECLFIIANDIIGFESKRPGGKYNRIRKNLRESKFKQLIYDKKFNLPDDKEINSLFEMCLYKLKRIEKLFLT